MQISIIEPSQIPLELLLEADPCPLHIQSYLQGASCYGVHQGDELIAAGVVNTNQQQGIELFNIATKPELCGRGIGKKLLDFIFDDLRQKGVKELWVGTGSFGYQLSFYQKAGFRVEQILKDHFLKHYADPLWENGIQHRDMILLKKALL